MNTAKKFLESLKCSKCTSGCKATNSMSGCSHLFCQCCADALKYDKNYVDKICSVCSGASNLLYFSGAQREIDDHIKKTDELTSTKKKTEEELKNEKETSKKYAEELKTIEKQLEDTNKDLMYEKQKKESMEVELNERIGCLESEKEILKNHIEEISLLKQKQKLLEESQKYQHECSECEMRDLEQNMQLCATCHELKFNDLEDVKKRVLCAGCAIKKHIRQGHQIVDFFPYLSAYNFSSQTPIIELKSGELKNVQNSMSDTISRFSALSVNAFELGDILTDMARRSKSTKYQIEFIEKMEMFIDKSKLIHGKADLELKENSKSLEKTLENIKDWYNARMDNCVDDSETIKLPSSSDADNNSDI